ncbi:hypothetical protein M422DRAFT_276491 [Sphaerobolus stellatus SS14]|uniref:NADAR domain-containing protein n=1 Tax=Sphaerobolus stellatus (strain SS14) TaxID=990650 RepID=A0A0C9U1V8_SPHS4|nr:hypothetical protein M422DRAFT_276491 [Sphaerobolus stellatus SS14]
MPKTTKAKRDEQQVDDPNGPVYFWKPATLHGYLGQWYSSPFTSTESDGRKIGYENAEQYMMHRKGLLFAPDDNITASILETTDPKAIKALGRLVPDFDETVWLEKRYQIVIDGNYLKFSQNKELKDKLLATGNRELVEASPMDRIWGVGFGWKNAEKQRGRWGLNLLGKALMEVRDKLRAEEGESV